MLKQEFGGVRGNTRRCLIVILCEHRVLKRIELVLPYGNTGKWH